ncbi:MAG TPA: FAD-dependent monooxygenase [Gammaproteobacteria bacterium]|nr:FAD-dependent monooxygenase [Gammaproteobacteria bacterium]
MVRLENVDIIGAGPAGLYTAILLKSRMPATRVRVSEQNPAAATFGFGVVFSDQALDFLQADDPETHALITPLMQRWRDMTLSLEGQRVTLDGIGFAAIGRLQLLQVLQQRAAEVGVLTRFEHALTGLDEIEEQADLIVGADGLNSLLRRSCEIEFAPQLDHFENHFAWFGTPRAFDTLTQTFVRSRQGVLNAHHYRYAPAMSTFIVECDPHSFAAHGFAQMDEQASAAACAELFADTLEGAPLLINRSQWRRFPRLWCDNWVVGKRVILGDAAHTAHFSIGSGTRLALEDSIALTRALCQFDELETALQEFQRQRQPLVRKIVDAANTSAGWYDDFDARMQMPLLEFAFSYLTRSGRVDLARLRQLSPRFIASYERWRQSG